MSLLRKSSLNQLKRINNEIKKQGGKTERSSPLEKNFAKVLWIDNPIDKKIATYDQMYSIDIPDASTTVKMKKENMKHINESKIADAIQNAIEEFYYDDNSDSIETISDISTAENAMENLMEQPSNESKVLKFEMFCESKKEVKETEEKTVPEINKGINRINNWHSENTPKREFNINLIGKFMDNGKVKGYIQRIEGTTVFVDSIVEPFGVLKLSLKDAIKGFKPEKDDKVMKVADFSITGPNNKNVGVKPSEGSSVAPKIEDKSTKAKDQKISDKINIVKFSNLK